MRTHRCAFCKRAALTAAALTSAAAPGCTGDLPTELIPRQAAPEGGAGAAEGDGHFQHSPDLGANRARDPFEILEARQEEGAPEVRARLHSCQKLQIAALRSLLSGLGVAVDVPAQEEGASDNGPLSAAVLLQEGRPALGAADYDARVGERIGWTTAGATKLFDIFVQAAPEIIANMPVAPLCADGAGGPAMFDDQGRCNRDAVTCLIGFPATEEHLVACENVVESATAPERGKEIAVAALLSAAYSCE
jgi:hypothetical protein